MLDVRFSCPIDRYHVCFNSSHDKEMSALKVKVSGLEDKLSHQGEQLYEMMKMLQTVLIS